MGFETVLSPFGKYQQNMKIRSIAEARMQKSAWEFFDTTQI